jgi:hypothetical protein
VDLKELLYFDCDAMNDPIAGIADVNMTRPIQINMQMKIFPRYV